MIKNKITSRLKSIQANMVLMKEDLSLRDTTTFRNQLTEQKLAATLINLEKGNIRCSLVIKNFHIIVN